MIMFSDVSVIQSVNHPQVPVWIDFSLRAKKIYIAVAYKSWTFSVWSCIPPMSPGDFFPQTPGGVSLSYINLQL